MPVQKVCQVSVAIFLFQEKGLLRFVVCSQQWETTPFARLLCHIYFTVSSYMNFGSGIFSNNLVVSISAVNINWIVVVFEYLWST